MSETGQSIVEKPIVDFLACLRTQADGLIDLVCDLDEAQLLTVSPCHGWRIIDLLVHLYFVDWMARLSLDEPDKYVDQLESFLLDTRGPNEPMKHYALMSKHQYTVVPYTSPEAFIETWHRGFQALYKSFAEHDGQDKVNWFGHPMRIQRLISARQMEVYCYGQDIFDALGAKCRSGDHIYPVAEFGVRTCKFSFQNRGLSAPDDLPHVKLISPSGETWEWNTPSDNNRVEGLAVDFCLVATQRRNIADTQLSATGDTAIQWMSIAQTISGQPTQPPKAGERG